MPKVPYVTQADWDAVYLIRIRDITHPKNGQKLSYSREAMARSKGPYDDNMTEYIDRVTELTALFPIAVADRIIIGGCGFGFTVEAFIDAGFTNCWGIDDSGYIATNKAVEARGDVIIIGEKFKVTAQLSTKLNAETGANNFKWIITESILESYDDGVEMEEILDMAESGLTGGEPLTNIIHMVHVAPDIGPQFNQKTLAQWKAIRNTHSWVDYVGWEVG